LIEIDCAILEHTHRLSEGAVFSAATFLHLDSRATVGRALSRCARAEQLLRIERGRYALPIATRFGELAATPEQVVEGLSALSGETIVSGGTVAANALGFTTQVHIRPVFLTSGRRRHLRLGKQVVALQHAPAWQLHTGRVARALAWLGPAHAPIAAATLDLSREEREELLTPRGDLPAWLAEVVNTPSRDPQTPQTWLQLKP
jgi:hypothetical protein